MEVLHITVRRQLEWLVATNICQHRLEIFVEEIGIFVAVKDAVYAYEALPHVGIVLLLGQDMCHHRIYISVIPGVLSHTPTEVLHV